MRPQRERESQVERDRDQRNPPRGLRAPSRGDPRDDAADEWNQNQPDENHIFPLGSGDCKSRHFMEADLRRLVAQATEVAFAMEWRGFQPPLGTLQIHHNRHDNYRADRDARRVPAHLPSLRRAQRAVE